MSIPAPISDNAVASEYTPSGSCHAFGETVLPVEATALGKMPSSDDHRAWGSEAAIHFKLHSTLCMWNTNLGVAVVLQGRWLGMKSRWAGMPICVSQRERVYLHLCLMTSSYELRDAQPWDQRGPRVIPSKHHHYNCLSRPKGPESWRAEITWPNRKIPFLASTVHHGICRVLHTYPRYGGYALCIHCLGRKSDPEWPSHDVASGEGKKKNHFATLRFELSNQGCEGRHSRKVIFALLSPKTRRSVRRLVLGLKRRLVKIRDVWWVIGWRWREAKGAKRTKRTKILKGGWDHLQVITITLFGFYNTLIGCPTYTLSNV